MPHLNRAPRIALSAGHFNHTGGHAHEKQIVGPVTRELFAALQRAGADVRLIQPTGTSGSPQDYPGTLDKIGRRVIGWASEGWIADLFIEIHAEANGAGDRGRGAFVIYPDTAADVDADCRDELAPRIVESLTQLTGIPARGTGRMSERRTGVGLAGHRLGIFATTASHRQVMTRAIVEVGSYTSPADTARMNALWYPGAAARALCLAILAYFGCSDQTQPVAAPAQPRTYRITATAGANIRQAPSAASARLDVWQCGAIFTGTLTPEQPDGYRWIKLERFDGYVRSDLAGQIGPEA